MFSFHSFTHFIHLLISFIYSFHSFIHFTHLFIRPIPLHCATWCRRPCSENYWSHTAALLSWCLLMNTEEVIEKRNTSARMASTDQASPSPHLAPLESWSSCSSPERTAYGCVPTRIEGTECAPRQSFPRESPRSSAPSYREDRCPHTRLFSSESWCRLCCCQISVAPTHLIYARKRLKVMMMMMMMIIVAITHPMWKGEVSLKAGHTPCRLGGP